MLLTHCFLERKSLIFSNVSVKLIHFSLLVHKSLIIGFEGTRSMSVFWISTLKSYMYNMFVAVKSQAERAHLKWFLKHFCQSIIYRDNKFQIFRFQKVEVGRTSNLQFNCFERMALLVFRGKQITWGHQFILLQSFIPKYNKLLLLLMRFLYYRSSS